MNLLFHLKDPSLLRSPVSLHTPQDAQQAIECAHAAWGSWRNRTPQDRAGVLHAWHRLMLENLEDLACIITTEQGKPLKEARAEVRYAASYIQWFAEEATRVDGEILCSPDPSKRLLVLKQPIGVCAAITPWNFPLAMITRKVAPALAAGCVVVLKPAEQTPLSALAACELAYRAGIPLHVFQALTSDEKGSVEIGQVLCASPLVRHLSFTGSTEVGRLLMAQCAPTVKRLSLELGGNAPFIVFDDADLDAAIEGAMSAKYRNAGQTCIAVNRFYVQAELYETFVKRMAEASAALRLGPGWDDDCDLGPLINDQAIDKVERLIACAIEQGAEIVTGGLRMLMEQGACFFEPTVLACRSPGLRIDEEIFGPVACIMPFKTEAEVIALANDTPYGLAAYLYTRDFSRIMRVGDALEYGMVAVNTGHMSMVQSPFGGVKQSGFGREGSRHGMDEYLVMKYLCLGGIKTQTD